MRRMWGAWGCVLALSVFMPAVSTAQDDRDRRSEATLGQNFPNPSNPETRIPFSVGDAPTCREPNRLYRVSLKIFNLLMQSVATPVLQKDSVRVARTEPLARVSIPCGAYVAYWDGKVQADGRDAASGVYLYRLEVDGMPLVRKMTVAK